MLQQFLQLYIFLLSRVQELHFSSKVVVCSWPTDISSPVPLLFYVTNLLFGKVPQAYNRPDRCRWSSILRDPAWLDGATSSTTLCAQISRQPQIAPRTTGHAVAPGADVDWATVEPIVYLWQIHKLCQSTLLRRVAVGPPRPPRLATILFSFFLFLFSTMCYP